MNHNLELRLRRLRAGLRVMKTATPFAWAMAVGLYSQPVSAATRAVTSLADSGAGTLRSNILAASTGDTIDFAVSGTITLTSGELVIGQDLTIVGPGADSLTVSGNHASRVFHILTAVTVRISGLTVAPQFFDQRLHG